MNVQTRRLNLKAWIESLDGPWHVTTQSWPDWAGTHTAQVGHGTPVNEQMKGEVVRLPLVLWVNEGNDITAVAAMYAALDGADPDSLVSRLRVLPWVKDVTIDDAAVIVQQVGQTWFTTATMIVRAKLWEVE